MWLKICGITRPEDARLAASIGVDAIGIVFWPQSRRCVSLEVAAEVVRALPHGVAAVGVFVNERPEHVNLVATKVGLHMVQLHGDETPADCKRMRCPVIKAFGLHPGFDSSVLDAYDDVLVLVDAHAPVSRGGTGRTADWEAARHVAADRRTVLSGGLTADNVGHAIVRVGPHGVDVSSGVETAPGIKAPELMRRFVDAVRTQRSRNDSRSHLKG